MDFVTDGLTKVGRGLGSVTSKVKEEVVAGVDAAPWFGDRLGETVASPFNGFLNRMGVNVSQTVLNPTADNIAATRRAVFGDRDSLADWLFGKHRPPERSACELPADLYTWKTAVVGVMLVAAYYVVTAGLFGVTL